MIGQVRGASAPLLRASKRQRAKSSLKTLEPLSGRLPACTDSVCVCFDKSFVGNEKGERKKGNPGGRGLM